MYKKFFIINVIGIVIAMFGYAISYCVGPLAGTITSLIGFSLMLIGDIGIVVQDRKEKREKKQEKNQKINN